MHIHVYVAITYMAHSIEIETCNNVQHVCMYRIPVCFVPHEHFFRINDKLTRVGCFGLTKSSTHQSIEQVSNNKGREVLWSSKRMLCLLHHVNELP